MDILRFITAGNVDDGKSTLIGRLLYDSKNILNDQLDAIKRQTKNKEQGKVDLALLTDGLRAEREQGITIDVAYKYFSTPKRKFIIADAPGHVQYTRNMVTGASNADLIIILVDARQGVAEQTRRHSIIASLLQIPHVVVAVNKMDLVNYSKERFFEIVNEYDRVAASLGLQNITYIPVSALDGDNIVEPSQQTGLSWYNGATLLKILEETPVREQVHHSDARFTVQYVIRPQVAGLHDYRGYAGIVRSGVYRKGDKVTVWPSGQTGTLAAVETGGAEAAEVFALQSAVLHFEEDIDISRGDVITHTAAGPLIAQELDTLVAWLDHKPLRAGTRYLLQYGSRVVPAVIRGLEYKIDVHTLDREPSPEQVQLNEVVRVKIRTADPIAYDPYQESRSGGSAILIDVTSNITAGAVLLQ